MNPTTKYLHELVDSLNLPIVEELVGIYFQQIEETKENYQRLIKNFNQDEVVLQSHKMKSSSRNIGANELAELFSLIEKNPTLLNAENYDKMLNLFLNYQASIKDWRL